MNAICLIYGLSAGVIISSIIFIINLYCRWKQSEREKAVIEITSYIKGYGDGIMEAKEEFVSELDEMENKVKTFFVEGYGYCEIYEVTSKDSHYCSYGERTEKVQLSPETPTNKVDTPTNTPTDLISRQAAIDAVEKAVFKDVAKSAIESLPPVAPVAKTLTEEIVDFNNMISAGGRIRNLPSVEPKTDLVNRSDVLELAKSGVLISNDNYEKVCKAINGLPSCHICRECETVEQKPVCEDAISRADTLKALCAECDVKCEDGTDKEAHCTEYAVINDMPPVEPKRPKGEWIVYPLIDDGRVELECPECGETFIQAIDYRPHFCENCGADMRGDKE